MSHASAQGAQSTSIAVQITQPTGECARPLLVLGHSLGTGPLIWEDALPQLESVFRVSMLTLPGHEDADIPAHGFTLAALADSVAATLAERGETEFLYAGVSIGGALGLELALRHPDVVRGAAVIASGAELGSAEHWMQRAEFVRAHSPAALAEASQRVWFAEHAHRERGHAVESILAALRATSTEGYARCAEALASFDLRDRLSEIQVPLLALWGEHDQVATEAKQDELVAGAKHVRKLMVEDCAHQPPAEQPEKTAEALLGFFGSL